MRGVAQLGLGASIWFPTGDEDHFSGDGAVRGLPALTLSGEANDFAYAIHGGILFREEKAFSSGAVGNEAAFGAAFGLLAAERKLQVGPELYGTTTLENGFERETTNIEAVLGIRLRVTDVVLGAAAGPGLTRGLGTPTLRALLSVSYAPEAREPEPKSDRDQDGIFDEDDACPDTAGIRSPEPSTNGCPDQDGDGVFDKDDACVDVPGDENEDPKKNGCPNDRDDDGIIDRHDACPDEAGVESEDPKKNGCPPDRDGDGIVDPKDACPDVPGIASDDPERNGCPGDTDGDGIFDDKDACPREKGKPDPDPTKNGCPTLVRVTEKEIVILQQVQFKTGSDQILPESDELLEQVAGVFREHPEITKVEIQGHTDNRGGAAFNQKLSERRAKSVVKWMVTRGEIAPERLEAKGYGMDQPLAENSTPEGRQMNRRVQFKIVEIDKPSAKESQ
jgi:outer membrane protein OmpA-like peptidoglycan-associated protein